MSFVDNILIPNKIFTNLEINILVEESKKLDKNFVEFLQINQVIDARTASIFSSLDQVHIQLSREDIISTINLDKVREIINNHLKNRKNKLTEESQMIGSFELKPNDIIGKYKIINKIGQGATSTVYLCHHNILEDNFVMKMIERDAIKNQEELENIVLSEIKTNAKLRHSNLVRVIDAEISKDYTYIIMEHVQGTFLNEVLKKFGSISEVNSVKIALELCKALVYSLGKGINHGNLKPTNIIITKNPPVKVADFGLAKVIDHTKIYTNQLANVNQSVYYMSPEQYKDSNAIDYRSDMYSLGIILYEMVTGFLPFKGENVDEIMKKHFNGIPASPFDLAKSSKLYSDIVMKLMEKEPEKRYSNYPSLVSDLMKVLQ